VGRTEGQMTLGLCSNPPGRKLPCPKSGTRGRKVKENRSQRGWVAKAL